MRMLERLKDFEKQYLFLRWVSGNEYGKIEYVGEDFIEFSVIDIETMEYRETLLINSQLVLEAAFGGADVSRVVAEISSQMSFGDN